MGKKIHLEVMDLFIITAIDKGTTVCSNIFSDKEKSIQYVLENGFDVWEGFTNKYVVIEKMVEGQPWTCEEVKWFKRFPIGGGRFIIEEIDKPKEFESITNFGVG